MQTNYLISLLKGFEPFNPLNIEKVFSLFDGNSLSYLHINLAAAFQHNNKNNPKIKPSHEFSFKKEITVLVIDDDDIFRETFIARLIDLTTFDINVVEADSGKNALKMLNRSAGGYDIIFLDMVLPDVSGNKIYNELAKRGLKKNVVMMSSELDSEEVKVALKGKLTVYDKKNLFTDVTDILFNFDMEFDDEENDSDN